MGVTFLLSKSKVSETPLPYTASPLRLMWEDIRLFFRRAWSLPGVILPLTPCNSGDLDELYPSLSNIANLGFQAVLSLLQILFLLSIPVVIICMAPSFWVLAYTGGVIWANKALCDLVLNRRPSTLASRYPKVEAPEHKHEHWVFVNGIACGQTWLQNNIDRLGYTFGRKVTGVHNPSTGLIFDVIQCLIQRDLSYATQDVRDAYVILRAALLNPKYTKVVLIGHSQGGIEAGLITDWLLDEIPQGHLRKLEIFTFGNAANHFNNPYRTRVDAEKNMSRFTTPQDKQPNEKHDNTILHIEHYANSRDFVSLWGVLNFTNIKNRFMGQVFVRQGSGHMFNQHYLGTMFPLGPDRKVLDSNPFMDTEIDIPGSDADGSKVSVRMKVKDLSRLWSYRNGGFPKE
ncbi:hypothetical protein ASPSYDRAFT_129541 [Aspergillus sydowii CBS 593.65]|uniref:Uncharacterized protein n=1 Tax=Aspergillus sydowii CBS 593.65 TaxID=1036612 RepID=A0A1L9TTE7_9EURO|nr:uncharacterized protein ASPSYDRAFT_129541 [Aspergillus sydowii CBS 593.65]OJJ62736.1 hypothetical protein ASPSYDRAFT_129541 [Aspergillus sydowii CBS 593.65]